MNASQENQYEKASKITSIYISDLRPQPNKSIWEWRPARLLSPIIKIENRGKEYFIKIKEDNNGDIELVDQEIKGEFTLHLGKVELDDGIAIDVPPLKFKNYITVESLNIIEEQLDKPTDHEYIFSGPVEEYEEWLKNR